MTLQNYVNEYKESHQNPLNIQIHFICVPLILWSVVGFLHTFSMGSQSSFALSHVVTLLGMSYYVSFGNARVVVAMAICMAVLFFSFQFIPELRITTMIIFILAWIGQFYGHKVEGKKPSFLKDLVFLLIGPVWVIKKLFPKFMKDL